METPIPAIPLPREEPRVLVYAGFWWRVLAWAIDVVAISLVSGLLGRFLPSAHLVTLKAHGFQMDNADTARVSDIASIAATPSPTLWQFHWSPLAAIIDLACFLLPFAISAAFLCSRLQATPGKLACRLRVTTLHGQRPTFGRALGRELAKLLSAIFCIGFLMVAWTRRKQGLHDIIAGTLVLRSTTANPLAFVPPTSS